MGFPAAPAKSARVTPPPCSCSRPTSRAGAAVNSLPFLKRPTITDRTRRRAAWTGLAAVVLFWTWIGWPYLHSIVVRDAAVTAWLNVATTPIAGELEPAALPPGGIVGADGHLAALVNPRADRTALARALGELAAAEARVAQLRQTKALRDTVVADYTAGFKQELDLRVRDQTAVLAYLRERLAAERADAARFSKLRDSGGVSTAAAEAAAARVAALEGERIALESALERTTLRRQSADRDANRLEDGSPADWSGRLDLLRAEAELAAATADLATARTVAAAARQNYEDQHTVVLTAPAGALVWSRFAAPGSALAAGAPVSAWIDPTQLLVDVPVSDVEAALLSPGARAHVVIEGERHARDGVVVFARGSAAALGARDLAALAKGRRPGHGQALVRLAVRPGDRVSALVGRAGQVDFPDVSIFTVIRARLRF